MASKTMLPAPEVSDRQPSPTSAEAVRPTSRARRIMRSSGPTSLLIVVVIAVIWEGSAAWGLIDPGLTSRPSSVFRTARSAFDVGRIWTDLGFTLRSLLYGMALGALIGECVGILLAKVRTLGHMFEWQLLVLNSMPSFAFAPIFVVTLGLGVASKVTVATIGTAIPVAILVGVGTRELSPSVTDAARVFGVSRWSHFRKVVVPSTLPHLLMGMQLGLTKALVAVIVAEMLNPLQGMGRWIIASSLSMNADQAMFTALVIGILGSAGVQLIALVRRRVAAWAL